MCKIAKGTVFVNIIEKLFLWDLIFAQFLVPTFKQTPITYRLIKNEGSNVSIKNVQIKLPTLIGLLFPLQFLDVKLCFYLL